MPLVCTKCGRTYEEDRVIPWRCSCGGYLHYDAMPIFKWELHPGAVPGLSGAAV